jgi:uncharacterized protein (TIGR00251 family)
VVPRAARSEIVGVQSETLRVRLNAPPVGGAANAALVALIAEALGVPKRDVEIIAGHASRRKTISVAGVSMLEAQRWLENLSAGVDSQR